LLQVDPPTSTGRCPGEPGPPRPERYPGQPMGLLTRDNTDAERVAASHCDPLFRSLSLIARGDQAVRGHARWRRRDRQATQSRTMALSARAMMATLVQRWIVPPSGPA